MDIPKLSTCRFTTTPPTEIVIEAIKVERQLQKLLHVVDVKINCCDPSVIVNKTRVPLNNYVDTKLLIDVEKIYKSNEKLLIAYLFCNKYNTASEDTTQN